MQADVELAVRPFGNLYLVGSGGIYSREKIPEIHRAYAMYNYTWRKNVFSLRYGKFYPNYGIMTPDHTRKIRAYHLIGRGQETLNVEGSVVGKYGEIFFTSILSDFNLKENYGLFLNQDKSGYAAKWALYAGEWAKFGYSYMVIETIRTKRISQGPFIEAGYAGWYLLAQQDYHENLDVYLYELGYEVFKGFQVYQAYEGDDKRIYGVKWYPIPHVELLAEKRDKTILGMFHYYF